jgi:hypothetical protein
LNGSGPFSRFKRQKENDVAEHATTVFILDFPAKSRDFFRKTQDFPANSWKPSKVHPIRRLARRTNTYSILETFLVLFTTRRFGCVGAPEGREKVPDHIFPQIKVVFLAEDYGIHRIFPQNS